MAKTHETKGFEDWARLAASIGYYTRRHDVGLPPAGDSEHNDDAVNGTGRPLNGKANRHVNGKSAGVDQLPNFLLQGPAVDDESPVGELDRVAVAVKTNGTSGLGVANVSSEASASAPFLLSDALFDDLDIPAEPVSPQMSELQRPTQPTRRRRVKAKKVRPPAATGSSVKGLRRPERHTVSRKPKVAKELPSAEVRPPRPVAPRLDFDDLQSSAAGAKQVGISAPLPGDRPGLSRRRLQYRLQKGAAITAVGVTIGGAAVAILYVIVIATTSVFSV